MTECEFAELRDLLPDFVAETLSRADTARVQLHVDACAACVDEVALLRVARAVRPAAVPIDVARIVAALGQSGSGASTQGAASWVATIGARRTRPAWSVWKAAAAVGVVLLGGWSVMMARDGGLASLAETRSDSARLTELAERAVAPSPTISPISGSTAASTIPAAVATSTAERARRGSEAVESSVAVSVGDLSDYTDVELEQMLTRLEKWDGATSTEPVAQVPIVPVARSRSER